MARNSTADNARSLAVTLSLVNAGWSTDPYTAGTVVDWTDRYPSLPIVADGRPCEQHRREGVTTPNDPRAIACPECYTLRGRGTTLIDVTRKAGTSILRTDFLSIKTAKIERSGKFPSRFELGTGNPETVNAIHEAAMGGASIPVVYWISATDADGDVCEDGFAIFVDAGKVIREHGIAPLNPEGYGRGQAPAVYIALSSRRLTGVGVTGKAAAEAVRAHEQDGAPLPPGKWYNKAEGFVPHFDEAGNYWSRPYAKHYSELRVSLSKLGIRKSDWIPCKLSEVARLVESQDWDSLSF